MTPQPIPRGVHIAHIIICFATFGFIFPHALMENIERGASDRGEPAPTRRQTDHPNMKAPE